MRRSDLLAAVVDGEEGTMRRWLMLFVMSGCNTESPVGDQTAALAVWGEQVIEPLNARPLPVRLGYSIGGNGHAETWDGRVFFTNRSPNGAWGITVFRPEVLAARGATDMGTPSFESGAFSEPVDFDPAASPTPSPSPIPVSTGCPSSPPEMTTQITASRVTGKNALAVIPARNRPVNPYWCNNNGDAASGPNQCYDLIVVTVDNPGNIAIGEFHARVIIENPGTAAARLLGNSTATGTRIDSQFQPYHIGYWRVGNDLIPSPVPANQLDNRLMGLEPTITLDGRLLVWNGLTRNTTTNACGEKSFGSLVYAWNATPDNLNTWVQPLDLTQISGDAARIVDGVRFDQRFPIAQYPMRSPDGKPFSDRPGTALQGAYPWISLDGTELVFAAVNRSLPETGDGAVRAGISMVGRWTKGGIRHIDGPTNSSRIAKRLFYSSPGAKPSFWTPYSSLRDPASPMPIPYTAGRPVYPLFGSNSDDYSEVSLEDTVDGDYVLSLHMNEMLALRSDGGGNISYYDFSATPDTSGNFNTGRLYGANFPGQDRPINLDAGVTIAGCTPPAPDYDQNGLSGCQDPWCYGSEGCGSDLGTPSCEGNCGSPACQDRLGMCMDRKQQGFAGQAIQFGPGAYVHVANSASLISNKSDGSAPDLSVELAVWGGRSASGCFGGGYRLAKHEGRWELAIDTNGNLVATVYTSGGPHTMTTNSPLPCRAWVHVAFTYSAQSGVLKRYINGVPRPEQPFSPGALSTTNIGALDVGPGTAGTVGETPVLMLDELKVSRVVRSDREIARSAYLPGSRPSISKAMTLPPGLDKQDLRMPSPSPASTAKADLGRQLFFDPRLSRNGQLACATCHDVSLGMSDGNPLALGLDRRPLPRRASAAINRAFAWGQFWDGRVSSLEDQVLMPLESPNEMGFTTDEALALVNECDEYRNAFNNLYGGVSADNLKYALTQYLRSATSGAAPADGTLSGPAFDGKVLFFGKARCSACHNGSNYTDELFHATFTANNGDRGRAAATGRTVDEHAFKTPSLRDVGLRQYFFHDGSASTLAQVVDLYNRADFPTTGRDPEIRPLNLTAAEQSNLVAFLNSLTGTQRPSATPPSQPWRSPQSQLRNSSFNYDVSYWTVVRGYYQPQPSPNPARQAWLGNEDDVNGRNPPMLGIVRLMPSPTDTASVSQRLQLPANVHDLRARVSQLLDNGGTAQLAAQIDDGTGWHDLGSSATLHYSDGWVEIGLPNNLGPYAGRIVTLRILALAGSSTCAPAINEVLIF
jgi:cytochrome c peroxidase